MLRLVTLLDARSISLCDALLVECDLLVKHVRIKPHLVQFVLQLRLEQLLESSALHFPRIVSHRSRTLALPKVHPPQTN